MRFLLITLMRLVNPCYKCYWRENGCEEKVYCGDVGVSFWREE